MNDQNENYEEFFRELYPTTKGFFDSINFIPKFGFKILNGPPKINAPYLFVGFQPGGGDEDREIEKAKGTDKRWPAICEYATENWRLAVQMRKIFDVAVLKCCVGTNINFLRYPTITAYRKDVGSNRKCIEKFCIENVGAIIQKIAPKKIVTIGFSTLRVFDSSLTSDLKNNDGRTLIKVGHIFNHPATAMIHLSGARISNGDVKLIANYFNKH